MKHRKLKKAVLITLFCLLILLEAVGISSGVMSIITAFGQALIGKAIFYIFLEIMTTMLYLNLLTFIWSEIRELRQAPANTKADVTPTEGAISTDRLLPFFPPNTSAEDMEQEIYEALLAYRKQ